MFNPIFQIILSAIQNTLDSPKQGESYFKRPRGSFSPWLRAMSENEGIETANFLSGLAITGSWKDVTDEAISKGVAFGKCRYFQVQVAAYCYEAACLLEELTPEELAMVRVKPGHHGGYELTAEGIAPKPTNIVHLVVGDPDDPTQAPTEKTAVVYTWYPGRLTATIPIGGAVVKLG